jgi:hypothetical protein
MTEENKEPDVCLDEEQIRALRDLGEITKLSVNEMLREGIELYINFRKGRAPHLAEPDTMISPIIFDTPYRKPQNQ